MKTGYAMLEYEPEIPVAEEDVDLEALERELAVGMYGFHETAPISLRDLVVLSQVRNIPNPVAEELKEDIKSKNLVNQIDVAQLDRPAFEDYVNFVNEIWKGNLVASDFPPAEDGFTYLVVAGHTRVEAMIALEDEKLLARAKYGLPDPTEEPLTSVKIKYNMTPDEIISLQLSENIYRQPEKERAAMAIVEIFMFGLRTGKWSSKAEFLRNNERKFNRRTLNDALHFAELPSHIRDFVLAGGIPYRAGVEIGKTLPVYKEYVRLKYFDSIEPSDMDDDKIQEFENGVLEWLGAEVAHVQYARQRGKFSGAVISGRYEAYRNEFEHYIRKKTGQEDDGQMEFAMADTLADWRLRRRQLRDEYQRTLMVLSEEPLGKMALALALHVDLIGKTSGDNVFAQELSATVERHFVAAVQKTT